MPDPALPSLTTKFNVNTTLLLCARYFASKLKIRKLGLWPFVKPFFERQKIVFVFQTVEKTRGRFIEHKTNSNYDNVLRLSAIRWRSPIGTILGIFLVKFDKQQWEKHGNFYFSCISNNISNVIIFVTKSLFILFGRPHFPLFGEKSHYFQLFGKNSPDFPLFGKKSLDFPLFGKKSLDFPQFGVSLRHCVILILSYALWTGLWLPWILRYIYLKQDFPVALCHPTESIPVNVFGRCRTTLCNTKIMFFC
jgi:hypothetical protein